MTAKRASVSGRTAARASAAAPASVYSEHVGTRMTEAYHRNLLERTGKTLDQWVAFVKKSGPADKRTRRDWLKREHGLTTNYATWIADQASGEGYWQKDPETIIDTLFSGSKAGLRPIYDRLLKLVLSLGRDVKVTPGKTMVVIYRTRLFARIIPSTKTRIDLALALDPGTKPTGRLTASTEQGKNRINKQIAITSLAEIDDEVKRWLKTAYDRDAD